MLLSNVAPSAWMFAKWWLSCTWHTEANTQQKKIKTGTDDVNMEVWIKPLYETWGAPRREIVGAQSEQLARACWQVAWGTGFKESRSSVDGWKRKMLRGVKKKEVCNSCGNLDWRFVLFEFYINGHNLPKRKGEDNLGTVMNCRRRSSWDWDRAQIQNRGNLQAVNKQALFLKKQVQATVSY